MIVDVYNGLKINTDRIDFVSFNPSLEDSPYSVCVNGRLFSLTKDEYNKLGI